jgi:23S rRNA (guanosine2251-2'-O)-methyltransferase
MVGRKRRRERKLVSSPQRSWLWGRHAVLETLRAGRWRPLELHVAPETVDASLLGEVEPFCREQRIPLKQSDSSRLTQLCGCREHQGVMGKMPPFPYSEFEPVLEGLPSDAVVLLLDGIQDPFNFGSILRSADLFGIDAVIVPDRGQSPVTPHVARSSAGAVNYLDIVQAGSLADVGRQLQDRGLRLLAATERGTISPSDCDLTGGLAVVIGNEGTGIREELLQLCDTRLRIPQSGHVGSLNAAVAAGILCYELRRQREGEGAG